MIQWFLLNRIYAKTTGATVAGEDNLMVMVDANKTEPPLTFAQFAPAWTQITLYAAITEYMPIISGDLKAIFIGISKTVHNLATSE